MNITTRDAHPDDATFLAKAILIAGRAQVAKGIWEVILGGTENECLEFLELITTTGPPHLFHYSNYLIGEIDGVSAGSLGGYAPEQCGYQKLQEAIPKVVQKLGLPPEDFGKSMEKAGKITSCLPDEIPGAWVIDSVATLPEYRGSGIADRLITEILAQGKSLGHTVAQVNMYIGNDPALKLYLKHGFEVHQEKRDHYFAETIGSPGMLSLRKDLP